MAIHDVQLEKALFEIYLLGGGVEPKTRTHRTRQSWRREHPGVGTTTHCPLSGHEVD